MTKGRVVAFNEHLLAGGEDSRSPFDFAQGRLSTSLRIGRDDNSYFARFECPGKFVIPTGVHGPSAQPRDENRARSEEQWTSGSVDSREADDRQRWNPTSAKTGQIWATHHSLPTEIKPPGFPVEFSGVGELHAPFFGERRTRGLVQDRVAGNPAPPDFQWNSVALANFMRLSLEKGAPAALSRTVRQEIRVAKCLKSARYAR
jgi:hypothetical protein